MPSDDSPLSSLPARPRAARQAIALDSRLAAVRFLLEHPGSTVQQLAPVLELSVVSTRTALGELEAAGFVVSDAGDGPRNGRTIRYHVDRERFAADLLAFAAWVLR